MALRGPALALLAGLVLVLASAGCGGGGGDSSAAIAEDAAKTAQQGSLKADFTIKGGGAEGTGSGVFNTGADRSGRSTLLLKAANHRSTLDTIVADNVLYMRSRVFAQAGYAGAHDWVKLDLGQLAQQPGPGGTTNRKESQRHIMNLEQRSFEIRKVNTEAREVTGVAVPFDSTVEVGGFKERFERGAISDASETLLFWNHEEVIGKVTRGEETDEGYEVTAVISETVRGNEAYTLLKDGVVKKFSVGFVPVEHRMEEDTVVRTKVNLKEVSLVPFPAYEGASVMSVRSETQQTNNKEDNTMSEDNKYAPESRVADIESRFTDLERKVTVLSSGDNGVGNAPVVENRTGGELLKGLLHGDDMAKRAFTGATTGDTNVQSAWLNRAVRMATENRRVLNMFSKSPHPGSTSVTLPVLSGVTETTTGVQAAEGDDLEYVEVRWSDQTFNNVTVGNYSSLSRQAIELGTPGYLTQVLEFQAQQYAKDTEAQAASALYGATGTATATLSADTFDGWANLVINSASTLASNGSNADAEFMLVSTDVFARMATLDDGGRPLLEVNGDGSNTIGQANIKGLSASLFGLPVVVDPSAAANTCYVLNSNAINVMESAGAPFRLQDENVINLTKDFSVYGYLIVAPVNKLAIVKVDADLA